MVKLSFLVVDVSALAVVRAVRDEFIDTTRPPTSSLVQVAGLFRPELVIEVEAVAWLPWPRSAGVAAYRRVSGVTDRRDQPWDRPGETVWLRYHLSFHLGPNSRARSVLVDPSLDP